MKVFRHSVLNLYATSGNLLCFLLVGVTQEIVFADLTFFYIFSSVHYQSWF